MARREGFDDSLRSAMSNPRLRSPWALTRNDPGVLGKNDPPRVRNGRLGSRGEWGVPVRRVMATRDSTWDGQLPGVQSQAPSGRGMKDPEHSESTRGSAGGER